MTRSMANIDTIFSNPIAPHSMQSLTGMYVPADDQCYLIGGVDHRLKYPDEVGVPLPLVISQACHEYIR